MKALVGRAVPALALPPAGIALAVLVLVYLFAGLVGHDPWKTEDAVGFGVVYAMLSSGELATLALAGEPYVASGPLYFWLAAASARAFELVLPLHDGARIASAVCVALALYFTRLAARELYGRTAGDLSLLALMGCLGFLIHARETAPETAALAAVAAAYYGIAIAWKKPRKAAVFFGAGISCAFLAKGLVALAPPLVAALVLVPVAIADRARGYRRAVLAAVAMLVVIGGAWLTAVAAADRAYLDAWIDAQWDTLMSLPRLRVSIEYLKTIAWAAWPAWPLTLWAAWAYRHNLRNPGFAVPLVASAVSIVLLVLAPAADEMDALVLLVPLAIPAGAAAMALRRGAANALAWFSLMTATLLAGALWVTWFAMTTGVPARMATNIAKLEPGFVPTLSIGLVAAALVLTALWVWLVLKTELTTLRAVPFWSIGLTLVWGLAMTLWLPWIDYGKSYRAVGTGARDALGDRTGCIASAGFGEVQRAVFHYHGGIVTERVETGRGGACRTLIVQQRASVDETPPPPGWKKLWEGARPRDQERYRLYVRVD
jgi:4-amino-4-deoxy-L-arabinose transferase-like glycosyltransferase